MIKTTAALVVAITFAALGNLLLRKGMLGVGALEAYDPAALWAFICAAATNPYVLGGLALEGVYFLMWMAVLSLAEVSWALPMHALEYIFVALMAVLFLGEAVSLTRWAGILLITGGVILLMGSSSDSVTSI